nr:immunoglobulin light chain junction region [Macaca mulatta]MOW57397.1 immunoglobulin light chain junction region [Macaca mulatta]MOW60495.1 immunoglobulin light chain junction region [Macaca mulatta]MOW60619.1 immunoglobulin light chain junction region [Macaca mulatta]
DYYCFSYRSGSTFLF